ncbi:MAG: ATP-binding protein [Pseudomonadota bacterium]
MNERIADFETDRIANLYSYHIVDSDSADIFKHITALATHAFGVPIACVSLVDEDCVWLQSPQGGLPQKVDRIPGLCVTAIEQNEVHHLQDASQDPRSSENPSVVDGGVRFYAGKSLTTAEGYNIGTICVMNTEPREISESETRFLELLSRLAINEIERHRNATELERAREHLHTNQQHYHTLAEFSPVGIFRSDVNGACIYVNKRAADMTGRSTSELTGSGYLDAIHHDDRERVERQYKRCLESGEPFVVGHRNVKPDGEVVRFVTQARPEMDSKCTIVGLVGTLTDVTEQRALEKRIQEAQKFESLALLAGGVAHDFNNLLLGIMGNASLLQSSSAELENQKHLVNILKASQRASDLCSQMLAYAGKGSLSIEVFDLNSLLQETAELLSVNLSANCDLLIEPCDSLPGLRGDKTQMQQVLMNLITNASDAIGDNPGTIELRTKLVSKISVDLEYDFRDQEATPGPYLCVQVKDTGSGIPEDQLSQIFDPFYTTKEVGHGLGMAAILGIVKAHHGGIKLRSQVGKGTEISLCFPASNDAVVEVKPERLVKSDKMTGTILIADDDEVAIEILIETMANSGFDIISATDGEQALELYQQNRDEISLIVLDMKMPRLDGREVCRQLRQLNFTGPVLFTSGYHEHELNRHSGDPDYGQVDFLRKPFLPKDLQQAVANLLETRQ